MSLSQDSIYDASLAIIGLAGRFPDAGNVSALWHNLVNDHRAIRAFSDEELRVAGVSDEQLNHPDYVKAGAVLADIDKFDAPFFGFTPREAEAMDPQSRLFLQCAWEALEDAGYAQEDYDGLIGIIAGKAPSTYLRRNLAHNPELRARLTKLQVASGNDADALATMVAYKLNLRGPSLAVQTFCSTSLVAVHLACQSLLAYETDIVLAGGVAIDVPQGTGYQYQEGGILSADGQCRTFDAHANGSVMGSGLGVVVLKRLGEAQADGDHIYAIIRGSAMNNDGLTRVSYAAPGLKGQAEVIAEAMANAGVAAESISYIETHGTATALGDSVELGAMDRAFRQQTDKVGYCAVGSIKPNIGHLDRASGVTGLIKTSLALYHRQLPPSLNFETPHPDYDWDKSPFYVNTELQAWPQLGGGPRRAGVSSFGLGGTNVHMVLEEAPPPAEPVVEPGPQLLLLSAKSEAALAQMSDNLAGYLKDQPASNLADVAYTLQVGRAAFNDRQMVVCADSADGAAVLAGEQPGRVYRQQQTQRQRPVAFLFPGVGDHYAGMGETLYAQAGVFRQWVDHCCEQLKGPLGCDLREHLFPKGEKTRGNGQGPELRQLLNSRNAGGPLQQTRLAQPAVFVIEYALAQQLMSWGIQPAAMVGHSLGEYVAACLAGVMSLEDALPLVAKRAELIGQTAAGALLTISLPAASVSKRLPAGVALSSSLTPQVCVVGGAAAAVAAWAEELTAAGVSCRLVPSGQAFHTPLLAGIEETFAELVSQVSLQAPTIPYLSNVTGEWVTAEEATDPAYWAAHLCQPVQLSAALATLLEQKETVLIEVGAGQGLTALLKQHPACSRERLSEIVAILPSEYERRQASAFVLQGLGKLWLAGVTIDWSAYWAGQARQRLSLPSYPFVPLSFWVEANPAPLPETKPEGKYEDIGDWFYAPVWKQVPIWSQTSEVKTTEEENIWLIFVDQQGLGALIAENLEREGDIVYQVEVGSTFTLLKENTYCLNPDDAEDYRRLLKALPDFPNQVVHLWACDSPATAETAIDQFNQAQQLGFYSLLFLTQAIDWYADKLAIWAITAQAFSVTGAEEIMPERAPILGACRVIAQENASITCGHIDVTELPKADWQRAWLAAQIVMEMTYHPEELTVAYRGQTRWVQTFDKRYLPDAGQTAVLRRQGVYLITGGLGGIGRVLARYLAVSRQAKLVLTTRSEFPPPDTWPSWLAGHDEDDSISQKIHRLKELELLGGSVRVVQADVADEAQMQKMLSEVEASFGRLHGVFHAAGVSGWEYFAPVQELSTAQCESHFRPKAHGLLVLEKVLAGRQLDFCLLFSSLSSILGGLGFAAYTAANIYIDAFSQRHNQQSPQWWSRVNWDTWQIQQDAHGILGATVAQFEMHPDEALQALERVIACGPGCQLVNSTGDLESRLDQWVRMVTVRQAEKKPGEQGITLPRPDMLTPYVPPTNETEEIIAGVWEQVLGIAPIGSEDNFLELGGHSLIAMEVLSQLRQRFQVNLPLPLLFEASTVAAIAIAVELAIIEELEYQTETEVSDLLMVTP